MVIKLEGNLNWLATFFLKVESWSLREATGLKSVYYASILWIGLHLYKN